ncbi:methyl-accepting chemotaxis protein [Alkalimarinus sediminis]|uniref:Methyl-accepting chemotaxis protein n=1 Tax=Alkalimarinus sediminis TaxID=1632866 RepID=A0A9E8HJ68_9ALTE|nr:methyl-accepting chemotaxis protein [Alkalimarinus sediminis]UZW75340.1 methyl-accepting chemotaxis protein [Alkalimarinus sediminis]
MDWLNKSIFNKLLAIIGGGCAVITLAALFYFSKASSGITAYHSVITVDDQNAIQVSAMLSEFKGQVQEWKNVLIRGSDPANLDKYWGRFEQQEAKVQAMGSALVKTLTVQQEIDLLNQFLTSHKTMGQNYRKGLEDFKAANFDIPSGDRAVKGMDREPSKLLADTVKAIQEDAVAHAAIIGEEVASATIVAAILLFGSIIVFAAISLYIVNIALVKPSRILTKVIDGLSQGHLDNDISIQREDELGTLADASRRLQEFLSGISVQLRQTTGSLDEASSSLSRACETMTENAQQGHSRTDQIAAAMQEMTATAQEVASHASTAAGLTVDADTASNDGLKTMHQAQSSINRLAEQVEDNVETVNKLAEKTNNVGAVLGVIRGIAEQTNLLALNAAIEAARAGEQGRGFAVVADEVRTLAQRTQESTAEIEGIIDSVQESAKNMVTVMDNSRSVTTESASLFNAATEKLEQISSSISEITSLNEQVATAAEEQTSTSEEITQNVTEVAGLTEETVDIAEETRSTAEQLSNLALSTSDLSQKFKS